MTEGHAYRKLGLIAQRWCALAERRRAHFTDLCESGRWKRYYGEEQLLLRMREVIASAEGWNLIAIAFTQTDAIPVEPPESARTSETPADFTQSADRAAA